VFGALSDSLTHYYTFEDLTDSQSSSTLSNSGATSITSGKLGKAYFFDGSDKMTQSNLANGTSWSINVWVNHSVHSSWQRFISQDGAPDTTSLLGRTHSSGGFFSILYVWYS